MVYPIRGARASRRFEECLPGRGLYIIATMITAVEFGKLDVFNAPQLDQGKNFYIASDPVKSHGLLDRPGILLSVQDTLPTYPSNVILLIVANESHSYKPYFASMEYIAHVWCSPLL